MAAFKLVLRHYLLAKQLLVQMELGKLYAGVLGGTALMKLCRLILWHKYLFQQNILGKCSFKVVYCLKQNCQSVNCLAIYFALTETHNVTVNKSDLWHHFCPSACYKYLFTVYGILPYIFWLFLVVGFFWVVCGNDLCQFCNENTPLVLFDSNPPSCLRA